MYVVKKENKNKQTKRKQKKKKIKKKIIRQFGSVFNVTLTYDFQYQSVVFYGYD
jgi:hypothetical protein